MNISWSSNWFILHSDSPFRKVTHIAWTPKDQYQVWQCVCVPTPCIGSVSDQRLTDERMLSIGGMMLIAILLPLRLAQIPGIEPIGYLSIGKCPGGGLSSDIAHLSYMSFLYELCWTLVRLWPSMGERLNRWSDLRENLTQSCDVSFVKIVSVASYLTERCEWISVCASHISGTIWVKLGVRCLLITKFSAGGFRGNWRWEGRPFTHWRKWNHIQLRAIKQHDMTFWNCSVKLLCLVGDTVRHCVQ
jgi:hypothetical protein